MRERLKVPPLSPKDLISSSWPPEHSLSFLQPLHVDLTKRQQSCPFHTNVVKSNRKSIKCGPSLPANSTPSIVCQWLALTPGESAFIIPFFDLAPIFNLEGHLIWVLVSVITCEETPGERTSQGDQKCHVHTFSPTPTIISEIPVITCIRKCHKTIPS